ncbi:ATP-binding protein [Rhodococcoides kyotonense]|uniref:Predicted ATPase n=1 Tax=Rhodococcoides kyotonense TaxID=398843 RepID=A0A239MMY2_9NOCA|nr:AAA family ATPase [Rhodococcus kyotonensis]SNT43613.1 Predicted ATPase [Rhodococcus kyotonensis]
MTAVDGVTVRLVGEVSVRCGARIVDPRTVGGPRCAETLAYLAVHRHRDVPMAEIAGVIWPRTRPKSWNAALRGVVSKVRETLEAASVSGHSLRSRNGYVSFALPAGVEVDLETVREQCRPSDESAAVRADRARAAHLLLTRPVLRGVEGLWADDLRSEGEDLRKQALEIDAVASYDIGAFDRAVSCAESLISLDPLRERAYRIAMRAYLGLGDGARALEVATRCRVALAEHLGVDPSPETERLFLDALNHTHPSEDAADTASGLPRNHDPLVGRDRELALVAQACEKAARGTGQCVVVTGDAGSGKTTLVLEAMQRASNDGVDVLFGRCSEDAIVAFEPFAEAVEREFVAWGPAGARRWLDDNGPDILRLIPHVAHRFGEYPPSTASSDDRSHVVTAVHRWLTSSSRSSSTMIVVDDLQWASSATHALLRYLLAASSSSTVCVVLTARTESLDLPDVTRTINTGTRLGHVCRIPLSDLSIDDVRQLVEVGGSSVDPAALHRRTSGHPLFVASLLAAESTEPPGSHPMSIVEFVRRREHSLTPIALSLLQLGAVIGIPVSTQVLRMAAHDIDDADFSDALDELVHSRMITVATESDPMWFDDLAMRHPLVQEVVYSSIAPGKRASLHSKVGRAFAEWSSETRSDHSARVAYHFGRGSSSDRALAATYSQRAGDSASVLGAHEDAVEHYGNALGHLPPNELSPTRCRLLISLGRARRALRDPDARATAIAALDMARTIGDRDLQIEAVLASERRGMMFAQSYVADAERVAHIETMCAEMQQAGQSGSAEFALLLSQWVIEHAWSADYEKRMDMIASATRIARELGDGPLLARVGIASLIGTRIPHAADAANSARADLDDLVDARHELLQDPTTAVWLFRARLQSGDLTGARTALDAVNAAHIDADPELAWLTEYGRFGIDLAAGDLRASEDRLTILRAIPTSPTDASYYGRLLPVSTTLRTLRGDMTEILDQSALLRANVDLLPILRPTLAVALVDAGERVAAADLLEWFTPEALAGIPADPMWLPTLALVSRTAADVGAASLCERIHGLLEGHADSTVLAWAGIYGVVHHHLAHLALGFGDLTAAARHIADAQRVHAERGFAAWLAESDYLAVRIDVATTGVLDDAALARARQRAADLGATAVVRRVDALAETIRVNFARP